jgi:hypothetical protein
MYLLYADRFGEESSDKVLSVFVFHVRTALRATPYWIKSGYRIGYRPMQNAQTSRSVKSRTACHCREPCSSSISTATNASRGDQ